MTFAYPALRDADRLRHGMAWVNRSLGAQGAPTELLFVRGHGG